MLHKSVMEECLYMLDPHDPRMAAGAQDIANCRVRTIKSGDLIEVESFPMHRIGSASHRRRREASCTSAAQQEVNKRNTAKAIMRYLNANFGGGDIAITCTYAEGALPESVELAQKNVSAYIRRLRRLFIRLQKAGVIPEGEELKYLYVSEYATKGGAPVRIHHHVICNIPDRDAAEKCWRAGRANADRLQPDKYGFTALAKYLSKAPAHKRRWDKSRNLKAPQITQADKKLSRRRMMLIADDVEDNAKEIFMRLYPGCEYLDCEVRVSEWVQGAYIYARLRRKRD